MTLQDAFASMADDLRERKLEVVLSDAPSPAFEGHKIRVVNNNNVGWYRELREKYPNAYRANVEYLVERLHDGYLPNSYMLEDLLTVGTQKIWQDAQRINA